MEKVEVYHAGVDIVDRPDVKRGRPELDFGQGFYVTEIYDQAARWAVKQARKKDTAPIINKYLLRKEQLLESEICSAKIFTAYDEEWLNFIIGNRLGQKLWMPFNYIEGGLADDRIVDTVDLYFAGLINKNEAINRLKVLSPNNQICLLDQQLVNSFLEYSGYEIVE